jgi:hypothetical protein
MADSSDSLVDKDLLWHPGTGDISPAQMDAIRTRHANAIRPIPHRTAMGHEHFMADADRGALLAELDRLQAQVRQQPYGIREECPDEYCTGWKDSGVCPDEPRYRHHERA